MIVSDGIIEQFGGPPGPGGYRAQFEVGGLQQAMSRPSADHVADLFNAVITHAGTNQLSDDATAVLVRW
jgi:hypothetical protein